MKLVSKTILGAVTLTAALSFGLSVRAQDSGISSYDGANSASSGTADFSANETQNLFPGGPGPGPHPGPPPHHKFTCFAQNRWGQQFRGVDWEARRAQDAAMYSCRRNSGPVAQCRPLGCR